MNIGTFLEWIASALHKGLSSESTTTAGFYGGNGTLYITHQSNKHYQELLSIEFSKIIESDGDKIARDHLLYLSNPTRKQELAKARTISKYDFKEVLKTVLKFRVTVPQQDVRDLFCQFLDCILSVKVVLDTDLFVRSEQHSGFHGEGRIIRYLFLKYLKRISFDELEKLDSQDLEAQEKAFTEKFQGQLWMGSSQGACTYCGDLMGRLAIVYDGTQDFTKDRKETWRHPFTMTTGMQGYGRPLVGNLMATSAAQQKGVWKGPKQ
ncbi:MAG TPA: hypothetical protein VFA33_20100 [Bryobacteraceae bacterium]|nr:hypothetical protein [Bryobacteraceae bacterium]